MKRKYKNIYVAASSQHVGKTTTTLGIVASLISDNLEVGYCKPVGQQFLDINNLRVDKDTLLFSDLIHFDLEPEIHSPVILGPGATTAFLDNPEKYKLHERLIKADKTLSERHEITIYEGTGHPGVGTVANVSNAKVAKLLDAGVIVLVEGGIGNTIDRLNLSLSLFREEDVPIVGVIINKVRASKMEKVKHYVNKWLSLQKLPLLGLIPYENSLAYPLMKTVSKAIKGTVMHGSDQLGNKIEDIIAGSLVGIKELKRSDNLCLVVSTRSLPEALNKIIRMSRTLELDNSPLSGIVITGEGIVNDSCMEYIKKYSLPVVRTLLDTYGAVIKISSIEVKINRATPWKVLRAIELVKDNIDLTRIKIPL